MNLSRARLALELSSLAYRRPLGLQTTPAGIVRVLHGVEHEKTDTQGFIARGNDVAWIAMRGTSSIKDWFTDASFVKGKGPAQNARVHRGFADAAEAVVPQVVAALDGARRADPTPFLVVLCGHSLGGALAAVLAPAVAAAGYAAPAVVTFGEPRSGDAAWAASLDAIAPDHERWVNDRDVVPRLPPRALGFAHSGSGSLLREDGSVAPAGDAWAPDLVADLTGEAVRDHAVPDYRASLAKVVG